MTPRSTTPHGLNDESRQFSLLVNSVTDYAIYMLDPEGVIRTWNPGGQRIKGYLAEEVIGTNFARFYLPEEVEAGLPQRNLQTAATEGRYVDEGWRLRQDGTRFRASVVIDPIYENGELLGFAKITRDITERHTAQEQLEEAQQSLLQAQKMEAIGKFTLGLAHDFNNLLTIIANCLDLLSLRVKDGALATLVDTAQRAIERGALLTRQLLTFGRGQALAPEELTLAGLLEDIQPLLQRAAGGNIRLSAAVPASLPALELDRSQLEAAILNLVCNSRDALPHGGNIEITASAQQLRDPSRPDSALQTYVCVAVTDNGEGISLADQARVFEPFFTTKPVGRGSGLGLSQVFGFTSHSKGFTQLASTPGQGTQVTLCFPAQEV